MNMPGPSVLQTILARAASDGVRPDAICDALTPEARARFVLDQIDACVLPRCLTFSGENHAVVTLFAVERSLARIVAVAPGQSGTDAHLGQPLRHASDTVVNGIAATILAIAADNRRLSCRTTLLPEDAAPVTSGISARQLFQALALERVAAEPMRDRLANLAEGFALGVCSLNDGWELREAETPQMTQALDLADVILGDEAALTPLLEDAAFLVFDAGNGLSIGIYRTDGDICALLGPSPDMTRLAARLFARPE